MKTILKLSIWSLIFVIFYFYQVQDRLMQTGEQRVYAADIGAAHDAAISSMIGTEDGRLNFDSSIGTAAFRSSLATNLGLEARGLSPLPGTLLADPVKIIGLYFLGDDKAPQDAQGHPQYPYIFKTTAVYRDKTIAIKETIYGPSVVAIIQYTHNVMTPTGKPTSYKKATYRYYPRQN